MRQFNHQEPEGMLGSAGPLIVSAAHARFHMTFEFDDTHLWSANVKTRRTGGESRDFTNILFLESDTTANIFGIETSEGCRGMRPKFLGENQAAFIQFLRAETARDASLLGPLAELFTGHRYSCELRATAAYLALRKSTLLAGVGFQDTDGYYSFLSVDPETGCVCNREGE